MQVGALDIMGSNPLIMVLTSRLFGVCNPSICWFCFNPLRLAYSALSQKDGSSSASLSELRAEVKTYWGTLSAEQRAAVLTVECKELSEKSSTASGEDQQTAMLNRSKYHCILPLVASFCRVSAGYILTLACIRREGNSFRGYRSETTLQCPCSERNSWEHVDTGRSLQSICGMGCSC